MVLIRRKLVEEKGFFLLQTVLFFAVILALAVAAFNLNLGETQITENHKNAIKALYVAEAGVQLAIHELEKNPTWRKGFKNYPFEPGTIQEVILENTSQGVKIESQGEVKGVKRRIRVYLKSHSLPFNNALATNSLNIEKETEIDIIGKGVLSGDVLLSTGSIKGDLVVDGRIFLDSMYFEGSLAACEEIKLTNKTQVKGVLISKEGIFKNDVLLEDGHYFSFVPVNRPSGPTPVNFNWYRNRNPYLLEEEICLIDELGSGIFLSEQDLLVIVSGSNKRFTGQKAIVSEGTVYIETNLLPEEQDRDALLIIAQKIVIDSQVTEVWAGLLAKKQIIIEGESLAKKFFGSLHSSQITFPPSRVTIEFVPINGGHLLRTPQTLFSKIDWFEILLM